MLRGRVRLRGASKREAKRYGELKLLEKAGKIRELQCQVSLELHAQGGVLIGKYIADFFYLLVPEARAWASEAMGVLTIYPPVYEDVKGFRTALYRWKKKHAEAEYGIVIREV